MQAAEELLPLLEAEAVVGRGEEDGMIIMIGMIYNSKSRWSFSTSPPRNALLSLARSAGHSAWP